MKIRKLPKQFVSLGSFFGVSFLFNIGREKMRKKRIVKRLAVAASALALMAGIVACEEGDGGEVSSTDNIPALSSPTNVEADFWNLTWEDVEGATGYVVRVYHQGAISLTPVLEETEVETSEFDLYTYLAPDKDYKVEVKAKGNGETMADSPWASIQYKTEKVSLQLKYSLSPSGDSYNVIGNDQLTGEVVCPDTYKGMPITSVSMFGNSQIEKIRLPLSMNDMGFNLFGGCTQLKEVKMSSGVTELGFGMFRECVSLTDFTISESVTAIGGNAFEGCTGLTEIAIPNSVSTIEGKAFYGCSNLESISLETGIDYNTFTIYGDAFSGTKWMEAQPDGMVFLDQILCAYKGELKGNVTIDDMPEGTKCIAKKLFAGQTELKEVVIPASWKKVPEGMFYQCNNLIKATISEGLTEIDKDAFWCCNSLKEVEMPSKLCKINNRAFELCAKLSDIHLGDYITELGENVFFGCEALTSVSIPSKVTVLRSNLFRDCKNLLQVDIPDGVITIEESVFHGCDKLENLKLPDGLHGELDLSSARGLKSIQVPEGITSISFTNCKSLEYVLLPDGLETIESMCFFGCYNLKSVELPDNVKTIGKLAFVECGIEEVVLPFGLQELDINAFGAGVKKVYYLGSREKFAELLVEAVNFLPYETHIPVYYYSAKQPPLNANGSGYDGNYWRYVGDIPIVWEMNS